MDALTECRFLLNLIPKISTLIQNYGVQQAPPAAAARAESTAAVKAVVTDNAYVRIAFGIIYKEPFPAMDDPRVLSLITAVETLTGRPI
jgi:hypothetical protein